MQEIDDFTKLILAELKGNREAVDSLRRDIDTKLDGIKKDLAEVKTTEKEIEKLSKWQTDVNDVWSFAQMKEAKDEIYEQKNRWSKAVGVLAVLQLVIGALLAIIVKKYG